MLCSASRTAGCRRRFGRNGSRTADLVSCGPSSDPISPKAVGSFDQWAYNAVTVASSALDSEVSEAVGGIPLGHRRSIRPGVRLRYMCADRHRAMAETGAGLGRALGPLRDPSAVNLEQPPRGSTFPFPFDLAP